SISLGHFFIRDQNSGRSVRNLTGVRRGYDSIALRAEDCWQVRHLFAIDYRPNSFVACQCESGPVGADRRDGDDFPVLHPFSGQSRTAMALRCKSIYFVPVDLPFLRDALGTFALMDEVVPAQVGIEFLEAAADVREHRRARHAFYSGTDGIIHISR